MSKDSNAVDRFIEVAGKIGTQRHLLAIRDSFATLMPLILAGSVALLINNFPLSSDGSKTIGTVLGDIGGPLAVLQNTNGSIWWGTFGMLTFLLVIMIGYNLAKGFEVDPAGASLVAIATYISIVPQTSSDGAWGNINYIHANSYSMFLGIAIAIASSEIYCRLMKVKRLVIKMPDAVPPAVARGFAAIIPGIITLYSIVYGVRIIELLYGDTIFALMQNVFTAPLRGLANTLPAAILIVLLVHVMWIFGLHGTNILGGITTPLYMPAIEENSRAFMNNETIPNIVTEPFLNTFVYTGGAGATLGLAIALIIVSRSKVMKANARIGAAPGVFNINEPLIFGLPIIFNPIFAIPFVIAPIVTTVLSYIVLDMGLVNKTVIVTHWSMPPIVSGFLATGGDWRASILQIINIAIATVIYIPFVIAADRRELSKENE